jgi:hydroxyacylglutathione hydrolase
MLVRFTFSPFNENTYLVVDENSRQCMIVDPGCYDDKERATMKNYITSHGFEPVKLFNTHAHIDHVFGNRFVHDTWGLLPEMHEGELPILLHSPETAKFYGLNAYQPSPEPGRFWEHGDVLELGSHRFEVRLVPGHSPASLCLVHHEEGYVISGDLLFEGSIGRYDLPGGDLHTLLESIHTQLMVLPDQTRVYPGHGEDTTVGKERRTNSFLN